MIEPWIMLPVSVLISCIAMAFGIGGAVMFMPFLIILAKFQPHEAAAMGLFIEIFGFGSGLIGFAKHKLISFTSAHMILKWSIPAAIAGVILGKFVPGDFVLITLSCLLFILAISIATPEHQLLAKSHDMHLDIGKQHQYDIASLRKVRGLSALGGFFAGLVSSGLGEINDYIFLRQFNMSGAVAAGTSVFAVAMTAIVGSITHAAALVYNPTFGMAKWIEMGAFMAWAIPGVIIGSQIGVYLARHVSDLRRDKVTASLFAALAVIMLVALP